MDKETDNHYKSIFWMIDYVGNSKEEGIKIKPQENKNWIIEVFADSHYCGDRDNRSCVTGYTAFINGVAISWKSKSQIDMSLSTTEVEYVAVSEGMTEMKF